MKFWISTFAHLSFVLNLSMAFARGTYCDDRLILAGVGDILVHDALQVEAHQSPEKFFILWKDLAPYVSSADIAYGNLEAPVAPGVLANGQVVNDPGFIYDRRVYHGTDMRFNFHPNVLDDLTKLGIDVVSTANNHSLDRRSIGVDKTIEELQKRDFAFTGTRKRNGEGEWGVMTEVKGKRIFWLACTEHLNGHKDPYNQVLLCYQNEAEIQKIVESIGSRVDGIILTPHWGDEYSQVPNAKQKRWAQKMSGLGVTAIIGNHPHVLQPVEWVGKTLVAYSLGNFVAWQRGTERKTSVVLFLDLRVSANGKLQVIGYKGLPIYRVGQRHYPAVNQLSSEAMRYVSKHLGSQNILMGKDFSEFIRCSP